MKSTTTMTLRSLAGKPYAQQPPRPFIQEKTLKSGDMHLTGKGVTRFRMMAQNGGFTCISAWRASLVSLV